MRSCDKMVQAILLAPISFDGEITQLQYIIADGVTARNPELSSAEAFREANRLLRSAMEAAEILRNVGIFVGT